MKQPFKNMHTCFTHQDGKVFYKDFLLKGISSDNFMLINEGANGFRYILKDKKGIWWMYGFSKKPKVKFLTEDVEQFKLLTSEYARDKEHLYLIAADGFRIKNSDPESFVVFEDSPYYAKDKNNLYALSSYSGLFIYSGADYDTLFPAGWNEYAVDKDNVYSCNNNCIQIENQAKRNAYLEYNENNELSAWEFNKQHLQQKYPTIPGWWQDDYKHHLPEENRKETGYLIKGKDIYFVDQERFGYGAFFEYYLADIATENFEILSTEYARDTKNVYWKNRIVAGADPKTFRVIEQKIARDANNWYADAYRIDCDYESFEIIESELKSSHLIGKDKNHVFYYKQVVFGKVGMNYGYHFKMEKIKGFDATSFRILSSLWAMDKNRVYHYFTPFNKADRESFEFLGIRSHSQWVKDKNHLYNGNGKRVIKGIDGATFEWFNTFWGKDKNHVFNIVTERIMPSIDAESFIVTDSEGGAEDKDFFYFFEGFYLQKKKK